jgi:hypothetical protein
MEDVKNLHTARDIEYYRQYYTLRYTLSFLSHVCFIYLFLDDDKRFHNVIIMRHKTIKTMKRTVNHEPLKFICIEDTPHL